MTIRRSVSALLIFLSFLLLPVVPVHAQFPIPSSTIVQEIIQKIKDEITRRAGEAAGVGSPLLLDQRTAFAPAPEITDFHPTRLSPATAQDLEQPLAPGDYSVPVTAYCTQWSIHQPGQGLPYKIARVQGKAAAAISSLIVRGTVQNISPSTINAEAWRIESGLPLRQWPDQDRALIDKLIPDHEKDLEGDFLQQAHDIYDKYTSKKVFGRKFTLPGMPSFDAVMKQSGDVGKMVLDMQAARQVLADKTISAEHAPELLYQPTDDGLPFTLPAVHDPTGSPWAEVRPGIFARFSVIQGNLGTNQFEFRITPTAVQTASAAPRLTTASFRLTTGTLPLSGVLPKTSLGWILGIGTLLIPGVGEVEAGAIGIRIAIELGELLITYSENRAAQALIVMAQMNGDGSGFGKSNGSGKKIVKPGNQIPKGGGANDKPSWVKDVPNVGETGEGFAKRMMDMKYGQGNWVRGAKSEFSEIQKWATRRFMDPP